MSNWIDDANCRGIDPDIFFPESKGDATAAKRVCRSCRVVAECFSQAVKGKERGIWGGVYFGADTAIRIKDNSRKKKDSSLEWQHEAK